MTFAEHDVKIALPSVQSAGQALRRNDEYQVLRDKVESLCRKCKLDPKWILRFEGELSGFQKAILAAQEKTMSKQILSQENKINEIECPCQQLLALLEGQ
jgi:hypothetical protein